MCGAPAAAAPGSGGTERGRVPSGGPLDEAVAEAALRRAASVLLGPPGARFYERLPLVRRALLELPAITARRALAGFCDHAATAPERELRTDHAQAFDARRRTLHLLDHTCGDARRRRRVRARIAESYADRGWRVATAERPDHLAVLLEFAACADPERGEWLLVRLRAGLERLHAELVGRSAAVGSPYAPVLEAVCATLPPTGHAGADPGVRRGAVAGRPVAEGPVPDVPRQLGGPRTTGMGGPGAPAARTARY
ncbi:hypothetical protein GCM10027570_38180 [Streptomonospora sediminis]